MDKQIKLWMDFVDKARENIINTFDYNGLIIDDLEALIQDMKRAQDELKHHIYPCETCGDKLQSPVICRSCYHMENPFDEI